ncbi:MAG: GDCCVxC domain-containing (seleno)protein [bacterium]|nr:GDCCVxC domain-containing (seleno)protein [bacterium]
MNIKLKSTITCPECGFKKEEPMPTDACQFFYICSNCKKTIKSGKGDCCVFCSYGDSKCQSKQKEQKILKLMCSKKF